MSATIDEALKILKDTGPEYGRGLSNHGPMATEALVALGRPDVVIPWIEHYKSRVGLQEHPSAQNPISHDEWYEALGEFGRVGDWIVFFDRILSERPWQDVLDEWVSRLALGGVICPEPIARSLAAPHGVIRVAHAVRSLEAKETDLRLHELAEGLGYWAARYQCLPAYVSAEQVRAAEEQVGLDPPDEWSNAPGKLSTALSNLSAAFARIYLANVRRRPERWSGFLHSVTVLCSVRLMLPYLAPSTARLMLHRSFQGAAVFNAVHGKEGQIGPLTEPTRSKDDLTDMAVDSGDEHAIKFVEACYREYELSPQPVFLMAALDAAERLWARRRP